LTDNFDAADGPPEELLAEWNGTKKAPLQPPAPKPRGMRGPTSAASASMSAGGSDVANFGSALLTCATPWLKSIATAAVASLAPPPLSASGPSRNLFPPTQDIERLSSPPPAIEDELAACMKAFAASRAISSKLLDKVVDGLDEVCFTPDIMGEVTAERLQSLTGFPEGHAIALRKFAREWCGKIDAKRARRM